MTLSEAEELINQANILSGPEDRFFKVHGAPELSDRWVVQVDLEKPQHCYWQRIGNRLLSCVIRWNQAKTQITQASQWRLEEA